MTYALVNAAGEFATLDQLGNVVGFGVGARKATTFTSYKAAMHVALWVQSHTLKAVKL